jgi:hypothetical protein
VPHTLQYPLERERDLQRKWTRLLQRTLVTRSSGQRRSVSTRGVVVPCLALPREHTTPVTQVEVRRVGSDEISPETAGRLGR